MSAWSPVLLCLLVVEGIFTFVVNPLSPEYDPSFLYVVRHLSAIATLVLLPGWPLSRLLLAGRSSSQIKVLGLGFVISTLFYGMMVRSIHLIDHPLPPEELYWRVAVVSVAGLVALRWVGRKHPLKVPRLLLLEVAFGVGIVVLYALIHPGMVFRPDHRCFSEPATDQFLGYKTLPGATLRMGPGFKHEDEARWSLARGKGRLQVDGRRGRTTGRFPIRLLAMWSRPATVRLCAKGMPCKAFKVRAEQGRGGAGHHHVHPRVVSGLISMDVPVSVEHVHLHVDPAPSPAAPIYLEDYSNHAGADREQFLRRNKVGDIPMIGEAFELTDLAWDLPDFLLDHNDMLLGYLLHSVLELNGGRSLVAVNLFYLVSVLLCFLLVCEIIRDAVPGRSGMAFLFASLAALQVLVILHGVNHSYLPDMIFTAYLLTAMVLLRSGHDLLFVVATIPAVLTRSTGVVICTILILSALLTDVSWRKVLRMGAICLLVWGATFLLLTSQKAMSGGLHQALIDFMAYTKSNHAATTSGALENAGSYVYTMLLYTSGLIVCLLVPRCHVGVVAICVLVFYSTLLMFSNYQPFYRIIPLIFICAAGVGANVMSLGPRWRRIAVPAAAGVGFLITALVVLFIRS